MSFAYHNPANVEFGVFRGAFSAGDASIIPVDGDVQRLLHEMVLTTREAMGLHEGEVRLDRYEPSERYDGQSRLALPLDDELATRFRTFFDQANLPTRPDALIEPQAISAYFCIIHDGDDNKLVAVRRASQFKAVLRKHLIRFIHDGLHAVDDTIFKLDNEFDIVLSDNVVYIKSAAAFEQLADIDDVVRTAAVRNTTYLERMKTDIGFGGLADYVAAHKRAARIIAALRARDDLREISLTNLKRECRKAGVEVQMDNGKLVPLAGSELGFLYMLDRRRYALSLIPGTWEQYEAESRRGVGVRDGSEELTAVHTRTARRRR